MRELRRPHQGHGPQATLPRTDERRRQCIKCLRPAELVPEVKGTAAELCAKAEILKNTAARISTSDSARGAVRVKSDKGCVREA